MFKTREEWLVALAALLKPEIETRADITIPPFRVTCGFPSRGGLMGQKKRVRGQCWPADSSDDGHAEIFISPVEEDVDTISAILAHEMIHAALPEAGHKAPFQAAAAAIGHVAPFTTSSPTDEFLAWCPRLEHPYPHRKLNATAAVGQAKTQSTRQLKSVCEPCGYTVRVTRKWIDAAGAPHCPLHGEMEVVL